MNFNQQLNTPIKSAHEQSDPVLIEMWRVKDARAIKYQDAAGLMRHLQNKYESNKR
ncbi:MAG: hypothetical protein QM533_00655 [Cytophagales bacterium]|nr:hypothetical protein [Cytophagales bacterium]